MNRFTASRECDALTAEQACQPHSGRALLASAVSLALASAAMPAASSAQDATPKELPKISVGAEADTGYKSDVVSSPKFTAPLLDTPQTISVIRREIIDEQGATSLSDTLRNTPGITFQLGENGNTQSGDTIFMRGFDTQNSIFLDNIRDLGAAVRDVFNLEQVEIARGPAGADNGRGATSGYVNLVSKLPHEGAAFDSRLAYGTENRRRMTLDWNNDIDAVAGMAFRINAFGQDGGVAGRDFIERQSWGVAPSFALGLDGDTRLYVFSQHVRQDNIPDGAVSAIGVADHAIPVLDGTGIQPERVDQENFYGLDDDFEDIKANMVTVRLEHDFNPNVRLQNTSRYGRSEQERILTAPTQAPLVSDDSDGDGPLPPVVRTDPDTWTANRTRHASFRDNEVLTNQTNVAVQFATGSLDHSLSSGLEFIYESQFSPTITDLGTPLPANLYDPHSSDDFTVAPLYTRSGAFTDGNTITSGAYLFDTIALNERWQITAGLRFDHYRTESEVVTVTGTPAVTTAAALDDSGNLLSWKAGLLFKPVQSGSVYIAFANSRKPPGSDNFALNSTGTNINSPNLDPQNATNIELGTKWDLLDGRLAATAALFHSENENDLARIDPTDPDAVVQYGEKEVEGIELGLVGLITPNWQISAGLTRQNTEVSEGSVPAGGGASTQTGAAINFSPKLSATLWTTYATSFGLAIGGGARYVDTQARQVNNAPAPGGVFEVPSSTVIDAFVSYEISDNIGVQLNAYNLTDEFYVAAINNSGQRYLPGTPLSYLLAVNFSF